MSIRLIQPAALLLALFTGAARADVILDGSLGPGGSVASGVDAQDTQFADFLITRDLGQQRGGNLFHSFEEFSVGSGQVATFTQYDRMANPAQVAIDNVFARVTAGGESLLDGTLRSSIPGANVFLLNPYGVLFGTGSELDVEGSFTASTADLMHFEDGVAWPTGEAVNGGLLTTAVLSAFGFTRDAPARILVEATSGTAFLEVPEGETLSLVGGDVEIRGAGADVFQVRIQALSGTVQIASVAGASLAEPVMVPTEIAEFDVDSVAPEQLGRVDIKDGAVIRVNGIGTSSGAGGRVVIRAGALVFDASHIDARTVGAVDGAARAVDIEVAESVEIIRSVPTSFPAVFPGINTRASSSRSGDVHIVAGSVHVGAGQIANTARGSGTAGDVWIEAGLIVVDEGVTIGHGATSARTVGDIDLSGDVVRIAGTIRSTAGDPGPGGSITVRGDVVEVTGEMAKIASESLGSSGNPAGDIEIITSESLAIVDGGRVTNLAGAGRGGSITLRAGILTLASSEGPRSEILARSPDTATAAAGDIALFADRVAIDRGTVSATAEGGDSGSIRVTGSGGPSTMADELKITGGGLITASTEGSGSAGSVSIRARRVLLEGSEILEATVNPSAIVSQSTSGATGAAGSVSVIAERLEIRDGGQISVASRSETSGRTGDIDIETNQLIVSNSSNAILAESLSSDNDAGDIRIVARDLVRVTDGSINSRAVFTSGGNIEIRANHLISLISSRGNAGSEVIVAKITGTGIGGNITLAADNVAVNRSGVVASANLGQGGNIVIDAKGFFVSGGDLRQVEPGLFVSDDSFFKVTGGLAQGDFVSRSPDAAVITSLASLSAQAPDVTELLTDQCSARQEPAGSLVVRGRDRAPIPPGDELRVLFFGTH